jgi:hypothetical protein
VSVRVSVVALTAFVLAGLLDGDALAKKAKSRFTATVNGKRLKARRPILAIYSTASFSVNGASKPKRGLVRTLTANCGPLDIKAVPLPTTVAGCFGSYTEAGSRRLPFRQWTGTGIDVTVESLEGGRITGTLRGTLVTGTQPADPPTAVEGGSFSIFLTDTGF